MLDRNDKDERLLSVASDIEDLDAPNFLIVRHFDNHFSFHLGQMSQ